MSKNAVPMPWPIADAITLPFWEACREHRLLVQACMACRAVQFYPRAICVTCGSAEVGWRETSGRGTVYSFTVARRAVNPVFEQRTPIVIALVDLDEGPRMMTELLVAPEDAAIGARVRVVFEDVAEGVTLPMFEPMENERQSNA